MINRTIVNKYFDIMVKLYKSLFRPHVEYCTAAWSPYYVKDKEHIEKIQHLSYTYILLKLGLWTPVERRNRTDLIEV